MLNSKKLESLVSLIESDLIEDLKNSSFYCEANVKNCKVVATTKRKYTLVDIGEGLHTSGRYMIDNETSVIYGIKGYGKVNKNHVYGTLDTINNYYWGTYTARELKETRIIDFEELNNVEQELININNAKFETEVIDSDLTELTITESAAERKENKVKNSVTLQLEKDLAYLEATKERREASRKQWKYIVREMDQIKIKNDITNELIETKKKDTNRYLLIHRKGNVIVYHKITSFMDAHMYIACKRDGDKYEENWQQETKEFVNNNNDYSLTDLVAALNATGDVKLKL